MASFQHSKRSDNKWCTVEVRWGTFIESLTIFFYFLGAFVNFPIQTLMFSPWLLLRKVIILQLELGLPCSFTSKTMNGIFKTPKYIHAQHTMKTFLTNADPDLNENGFRSTDQTITIHSWEDFLPFQPLIFMSVVSFLNWQDRQAVALHGCWSRS